MQRLYLLPQGLSTYPSSTLLVVHTDQSNFSPIPQPATIVKNTYNTTTTEPLTGCSYRYLLARDRDRIFQKETLSLRTIETSQPDLDEERFFLYMNEVIRTGDLHDSTLNNSLRSVRLS